MNRIIREDVENIISADDIPFEGMYGKTVLIAGANGYVPAYFVHTFLSLNRERNAGIKVLALCRNEDRARQRFADYLGQEDFRLIIQDIRTPIELDEDIQIYIHAASPASIKKRYEDPVNTFLANVKGADNMLHSAVQNHCEYFLFLSSVDVYGKMENHERLKEDALGYLDFLNSRNIYSCGKRAAEALCKAYQVKYDLPVFIVRPFQIMGPGPELDDGRLHIDFISQMLGSNAIILKSDGTAIRTFMYITDAIKAMLMVMLKGRSGEAYNIVAEEGEASVKELAELMASNVTDRKIEVLFDYEKRNSIEVTGALSVVTGDSEKLSALGFQNEHSLAEGSARMMQYYGLNVKGKNSEKTEI